MRNKFLTILFIGFIVLSCKTNNQYNLLPFTDGDKWGFTDNDENIILTTKYDDVYPFSEGLAAVKINEKWGFINQEGTEVIIPIKYDKVGSFTDGYAIVNQNNKWGFINKKGKEVIPPEKYDYVAEFSEGLAIICKNNSYGFIDKKGKSVIEAKYDLVWNFLDGKAKVYQNNRFGYVNKKGTEIIPVKYDFIYGFNKGIALARQKNSWLFINEKGEEIKELNYGKVWDCDNLGYYKVINNEGKFGFIDNNGIEKILLKYDYASDYQYNTSIVEKNGAYGIIDRYGKEIVPILFESIKQLNEVIFEAETNNSEIEFLNPYGKNEYPKPNEFELSGVDIEKTNGSFTDKRDNQTYNWIKIGTQVWMSENLKYQIEGSKCFETKTSTDCDLFGRYYQWDIANNVCPEGWRLPAIQDWITLFNELGNDKIAYSKLIEGGESGLDLKLGGYFFNQESFENVNDFGYYWTSNEDGPQNAVCVWLNKNEQSFLQFSSKKSNYRNVRCIKE